MLGHDTGEGLCMVTVQVSWDTQLFDLVELYSGDILQMEDHDTGESNFASCCSGLFKQGYESVEFYLEHGHEMTVNWWH